MKIQQLKNYIQSANVSFLIGSGCSRPFLATLGNVENLLTQINSDTNNSPDVKKTIKASVYKAYFDTAIYPNLSKLPDDKRDYSISEYARFLSIWNEIISKRGSRLLPKQVNLYTTNVDTLIENAAETISVELNDGFKGSVHQYFDESNFQKTISKTSLHFQNISELPVFNLLKIHGSINWSKVQEDRITNDYGLQIVRGIQEELGKIPESAFVPITSIKDGEIVNRSYDELAFDAEFDGPGDTAVFDPFMREYEKLIMVNPTKQKFVETVMDMHFYELMRQYSNTLERENSLLFVAGFSFADEHIAKLTLRAANANPTLQIIILAFSDGEEASFKDKLKMANSALNNNIYILTPQKLKDSNKEDSFFKYIEGINYFGLKEINDLFDTINKQIPVNYGN